MEEETASQETSSSSSKGMNPMMIAAVVIVLLLIAGGAYALMKAKPQTVTPGANTVQPTTTAVSPSSSPSGAMASEKTIEVDGQNFSFTPSTITVSKGDKVTINFKNTGGNHDFVIDEFNVKTDIIGSGKTATVSFTADKAGTFEYYCGVGNHRAMGMKGTLIVQ